jgi:hypothetical protein
MDDRVTAEVKFVLAFGDGAAKDRALDGYIPPNPDHFGFSAQVFIGDTESDRYDNFESLCAPPPGSLNKSPRESRTASAAGACELFPRGSPRGLGCGSCVAVTPPTSKTRFERSVRPSVRAQTGDRSPHGSDD